MDIFDIVSLNRVSEYYKLINDIDINVVDDMHRNLLHLSILNNCFTISEDLLNRGINVNCQDAEGNTPLHYAAEKSNLEICSLILNKGGKLDIMNIYGNSPVWTAVFNARGKYELIKLFMNYDCNPTQKNKHGKSPLDFAKQINDLTLINILKYYSVARWCTFPTCSE